MKFASLLLAGLLAGCASLHEPVPQGYTGPTAWLADSGFSEDGTKAQFFAVVEIDGKQVDNTLFASRRASHNQGFALTTQYIQRTIPATTMKVKLVGTHQTAAPIHELMSRAAGTFFSVEGEVEFTPAPGGSYVVTGELKKEGSSVWIEDASSKQAMTIKVQSAK